MNELTQVLAAFEVATQCEAAVWMHGSGEPKSIVRVASTRASPEIDRFPAPGDEQGVMAVEGENGERRSEAVVSLVPGPRRAWLVVGPSHGGSSDPRALTQFLLPVVAQYLQSALEVEHAANELAERYEEINLLYTISEILGRTVSLEEATKTILSEVSETVGARRASVLVADKSTNMLRAVAALGVDPADVPAISVDDRVQRQRARFPLATSRAARGRRIALSRGGELPPRRDALRADHVDGARAARVGAARRREPLRPALRAAVHGRRPEAHRGDRDADRHGDPELAPRARVDRAAAVVARDAARARPADETAARQRDRRAGRQRGGARHPGGERRRRLLQPVSPRQLAHGRDDRRRLRATATRPR